MNSSRQRKLQTNQRRFRQRNPEYMREWMRDHRVGSVYLAVKPELEVFDPNACQMCGIVDPDRQFVCEVSGCPQ